MEINPNLFTKKPKINHQWSTINLNPNPNLNHHIPAYYVASEYGLALGCICFGWKWFSEILFRKCGCLVAHGKYIFWKCFSVWPCVGCKMISVFILPSNIIFWKTEREREREREERAHRRRPRNFAPWTHEPTNQSSTSLANPEPEPSTHRSST